MTAIQVDAYGHKQPLPNANVMAAGAVGVVTAGTISGTTSAGAAPTVTSVVASDDSGVFILNPITGGGAQAAGIVATVRFAQSYSAPPKIARATITDITTLTAPAVVGVVTVNVASSGFDIETAALTTAHNYLVTYDIIP